MLSCAISDRNSQPVIRGLRHDSGDPVEWGEKAIAHYKKLGIDPLSKVLVFSDNLDLTKALDLLGDDRLKIAHDGGEQFPAPSKDFLCCHSACISSTSGR